MTCAEVATIYSAMEQNEFKTEQALIAPPKREVVNWFEESIPIRGCKLGLADIKEIYEELSGINRKFGEDIIANLPRNPEMSEAEWEKVFRTNVIAPIKMVEILRSNLVEAGSATVAILSSKMGSMSDNTSGGSYLYRSSKAALNAAGKSLAIDLAEEKIKVVLLHPGWVLTDMGGPNALIDATTSVQGMRRVIQGVTAQSSGEFVAYDGTVIPW